VSSAALKPQTGSNPGRPHPDAGGRVAAPPASAPRAGPRSQRRQAEAA